MDNLILIAAALYGAVIGSFLNVCIFRLPRRCLRVWRPKGSFCIKCRRPIRWYENLPLLSYVALGAKCRGCKTPISIRYFLVELVTALLFLYVASRQLVVPYGEPRHWGLAAIHALMGCALLVATLVDFEFRTIPDEIDVPGVILAPVAAAVVPELFLGGVFKAPLLAEDAGLLGDLLESALVAWGLAPSASSTIASPARWVAALPARWPDAYPVIRSVFASLLGAGLGAGVIAVIGWAGSRAFGREAMGFGDVKFMGMIGGFTGWQGVLGTMLIASVVGTAGGILAKIWTGRPRVTGKDLDEATPLAFGVLRLLGAPVRAPPEQEVPLRFAGGLAARFATGDAYIAFGPFLALGGLACLFWPHHLWDLVLAWTAFSAAHSLGLMCVSMALLGLFLAAMIAARTGAEPEDAPPDVRA